MKNTRHLTIDEAAEEIYKKANNEWKKEIVIYAIRSVLFDSVRDGLLYIRSPLGGYTTGADASRGSNVMLIEAFCAAETEGVLFK